MTAEQARLVRNGWQQIKNVDPSLVADLFHSKLFADNPSLRKMFPADMKQQYLKLMDMINVIVARLDRPDELSSEVLQMAARHRQYGVRPGHYKLVGIALFWIMEKALGKSWNSNAKEAWMACYKKLVDLMTAPAAPMF